MNEVVQEWYSMDKETLVEMILAADHMGIHLLASLISAKIASMMEGKSPDEIRREFGVANDFSPEEEEQLRAETCWWKQT